MVWQEEGACLRSHRLLSHPELDQGRHLRLQVQDARRLRSLPHQLRYL